MTCALTIPQEQAITEGGRYQVKTEEGRTSLTIHDVVPQDCDKYTIVVRNSLCAHAAFASLAVGSEYCCLLGTNCQEECVVVIMWKWYMLTG